KGMPVLAVVFSVAGIIVSLIMADAVPSASLGSALELSFGLDPRITGTILSIFTAIVVFGGAKRIIKWSEIIVPLVCVFYVFLSFGVFVSEPALAFKGLGSIFKNAFSLNAGFGGLVGVVIRQGLAKGVFSHEAGMGTDPILAASTSEKDPKIQGLVSMLGPFLDTVVFCTLTAVVIVMSENSGTNTASMARNAFCDFFPSFGGWALDTVLLLLVLATLSSWAFYGEACVRFLTVRKLWVWIYRGIYSIVPLVFCGADLAFLLAAGDLATAFMAVPNVVLCILFISEVKSPIIK
ncbi:MAG: alanine:cation symporter family protein, partial [Clostridia bacterium]|nr:alanine:cation symporter family protein [Clostridia bacterium]